MLFLLLFNPGERFVQLTLNDLLLCYMICISVLKSAHRHGRVDLFQVLSC